MLLRLMLDLKNCVSRLLIFEIIFFLLLFRGINLKFVCKLMINYTIYLGMRFTPRLIQIEICEVYYSTVNSLFNGKLQLVMIHLFVYIGLHALLGFDRDVCFRSIFTIENGVGFRLKSLLSVPSQVFADGTHNRI